MDVSVFLFAYQGVTFNRHVIKKASWNLSIIFPCPWFCEIFFFSVKLQPEECEILKPKKKKPRRNLNANWNIKIKKDTKGNLIKSSIGGLFSNWHLGHKYLCTCLFIFFFFFDWIIFYLFTYLFIWLFINSLFIR